MRTLEIKIKGIVQGVGFRPFIHRLVREHALNGNIRNTSSGVTMNLEGEEDRLAAFLRELPSTAPPLAVIEEIRDFLVFRSSQARDRQNGTLSFRPISASARTACGKCVIPRIADIASRSSTAQTAVRALRLSRMFPMTGRRLR